MNKTVVYDLETHPLPPTREDLELMMAEYKAPGNIKAAHKLDDHRREFEQNLVAKYYDENAFCFPRVKIYAATFVTVSEGIEDVQTFVGDNVIHEFAEWWNSSFRVMPTMVGYNIETFDKPMLISNLTREKVRLSPRLSLLPSKWVDIRKPLCGYSGKGTLKAWALASGLGKYDAGENGSMVAELVNNRDWARLADYCTKDTVMTAELYLRLKASVDI